MGDSQTWLPAICDPGTDRQKNFEQLDDSDGETSARAKNNLNSPSSVDQHTGLREI